MKVKEFGIIAEGIGEKVQPQVIVKGKLKAEVLGKEEGLKKMKNYE